MTGNFLTLKQAQQMYNISRAFIYQLRKKKKLQFYHVEGKPFIKISEFEQLMKAEDMSIAKRNSPTSNVF